MKITIVGLGGGTPETLTIQAREALLGAGCIIGAKRLLESLPEGCTDNTAAAITAAHIEALPQNSPPAIRRTISAPSSFERKPTCSAAGSASMSFAAADGWSAAGTGVVTRMVVLPVGSSSV